MVEVKDLLVFLAVIVGAAIFVGVALIWRKGKPLIHHFRATNIWKAFVLNSIATTLVIFIAMTVKSSFDTYTDKDGNHLFVQTQSPKESQKEEKKGSTDNTEPQTIKHSTNPVSVILTIIATFATSMVAYTIMYVFFGFGGGMLTSE